MASSIDNLGARLGEEESVLTHATLKVAAERKVRLNQALGPQPAAEVDTMGAAVRLRTQTSRWGQQNAISL